ncbi:hypothetical protein P692DRAFT_20822239 [Suillus brevipes Sb2]|nr:hypothetical protein P692DRAFT_20822239 [Suillus brevipes Sb2]
MTIKAWDWDKQWKCIQVYEGHTHYIMNITFNPKDSNTFASAYLDRSLASPTANFTMDAHDKGVNHVDFYPGSDKPYLITTGDDRTIKIWDYLSKSCVQTMAGHTNNPSLAVFHPNLPIIISGSEDSTVKIWNSNTYRLDNTLSYALERAWCVSLRRDTNEVAVGFDEGIVVIKLGRDGPTYSMDPSGKLIYTKNQVVLSGNLATAADGNRIPLSIKEIGTTEIFATALLHSPNGRFVTVVGDGEYIIYTALAWRNKVFGSGTGFAWAGDSNTYAVLESKVKLRVFKNFKERGDAGMKKEGVEITDEGVEEAFDVVVEISDRQAIVKTAKWIGDCFIYTTAGNRLNYFVGNESYTISPSDTSMFILGYIPAHNQVYLADKDMNIFGYSLSLSVVEYQTAVLRGDMDSAAEILPTLPKEQLNKVARFLEGRANPSVDLKELALQVTTDPDHQFDLSLQLDDLDTAVKIARSVLEPEAETKWKAIGDRALMVWRFDLAREAFEKAGDLNALMLLLLSTGDREGLQKLAATAEKKGANNLAFATLFQLGDAKPCVDLLVKTNRAPEAALFARTYAPSEVPKVVDVWRDELRTKNKGKIAWSIAHPSEHAELFEEGWEEALVRKAGGPVDVNGDYDISLNSLRANSCNHLTFGYRSSFAEATHRNRFRREHRLSTKLLAKQFHLYEGHKLTVVTYGITIMKRLGVKVIIRHKV